MRILPVTTAAVDAQKAAAEELSSETFLTLLAAELQNQDPLEPLSGEQMLTQITQLTTVGELLKLNDNFTKMATVQIVTGVSQLVGRTVHWKDPETGRSHSGTVTRVQVGSKGWEVCVGEQALSWDSITAIE